MREIRAGQWGWGLEWPGKREGGRKEEGLNRGMGDALEERGLHLCAGMQKGETGSKRMSGVGPMAQETVGPGWGQDSGEGWGQERNGQKPKMHFPTAVCLRKFWAGTSGEGSVGRGRERLTILPGKRRQRGSLG